MLRLRSRLLAGAATLGAACGAVPAFGQWFGGGSSCGCAQPVAYAPAPVVTNACCGPAVPVATMTPVTQMVYKEMPVTEYRTVQKVVKQPVVRVAYEDRPVTAYRQVMETKTAQVQGVDYQSVCENKLVTRDQSYWRTQWQPVAKCDPCQYDARQGFMGSMNRFGVRMRNAMTPSYTAKREYVPNMVAYNVPQQRTVAVPTTRQVAYNVARMEPYQTTERVAVQKIDYVDQTVTAYEPYTVSKVVAVGTTTQYAWSGSPEAITALGLTPTVTAFGGGTILGGTTIPQTAIAPQPTPAANAAAPGSIKLNSYERPVEDNNSNAVPVRPLNGLDVRPNPQPVEGKVATAGWRSYRPRGGEVPVTTPISPIEGPALTIAAN
jgi:hypothetical protein